MTTTPGSAGAGWAVVDGAAVGWVEGTGFEVAGTVVGEEEGEGAIDDEDGWAAED
jgi:hypothetical protein